MDRQHWRPAWAELLRRAGTLEYLLSKFVLRMTMMATMMMKMIIKLVSCADPNVATSVSHLRIMRRKIDQEGRAAQSSSCWILHFLNSKIFRNILTYSVLRWLKCDWLPMLYSSSSMEPSMFCGKSNVGVPKQYHCISDILRTIWTSGTFWPNWTLFFLQYQPKFFGALRAATSSCHKIYIQFLA